MAWTVGTKVLRSENTDQLPAVFAALYPRGATITKIVMHCHAASSVTLSVDGVEMYEGLDMATDQIVTEDFGLGRHVTALAWDKGAGAADILVYLA